MAWRARGGVGCVGAAGTPAGVVTNAKNKKKRPLTVSGSPSPRAKSDGRAIFSALHRSETLSRRDGRKVASAFDPSRVETPSRRDASSRARSIPRALARAPRGRAPIRAGAPRASPGRRAPPPLAPFSRTRPDASSDRRDRPSAFSARGVDRRASLPRVPASADRRAPSPPPSTSRASTASPRSPLRLPRVPRLQLVPRGRGAGPAGSHPRRLRGVPREHEPEQAQPRRRGVPHGKPAAVRPGRRQAGGAPHARGGLRQGVPAHAGPRRVQSGHREAPAGRRLGRHRRRARRDRAVALGHGLLRVGAAFIAKFMPGAKVFLPSPTWGNHKNIFADAGVEWDEYAYYDAETIGLDLEGMLEAISSAPEGSVFVLHGCAHNPTGVDPTMEEWEKIADAMASSEIARPVFRRRVPGLRQPVARGGRRERPTVREEGHRVLLRAVVQQEPRPVRRARGRDQRGSGRPGEREEDALADEPHRSRDVPQPSARREDRGHGDRGPGSVRAVERGDARDGGADQDRARDALRRPHEAQPGQGLELRPRGKSACSRSRG